MGSARREFDHGRMTMRREASRHINDAHRRFGRQTREHYGRYRDSPRWEQAGMRRPPSYGSYYGAGFGKKHFKGLEKKIHRHIDKIFSRAKKHTMAGHRHVRKNGKRGAAQAKRDVKREITAARKLRADSFPNTLPSKRHSLLWLRRREQA